MRQNSPGKLQNEVKDIPLIPVEGQLAEALRSQPAVWTEACPEPEELYELVQKGDKLADADRLRTHLFTCAYCRDEYIAIRETLALTAARSSATKQASMLERLRERLSRFGVRPLPDLAFAAALLLLYVGMKTVADRQQAEQNRKSSAQITALQQQITQLQEEVKNQTQATQLAQEKAQKTEQKLQEATQLLASRHSEPSTGPLSPQTILAHDGDAAITKDGKKGFMRNGESLPVLIAQVTENPAELTVDAKYRRMTDGGGPVRSSGEKKILLEPNAQTVEDDRPEFHWKACQNAQQYKVIIKDSEGDREWDFVVPASETQAKAKELLPRGKEYFWQVKATNADSLEIDIDGNIVRSSSKEKHTFFVLDAMTFKELTANPNSLLIRGILYAHAGLFKQAEQALESLKKSNPGNPLPDKFLQRVQALRPKPQTPHKTGGE